MPGPAKRACEEIAVRGVRLQPDPREGPPKGGRHTDFFTGSSLKADATAIFSQALKRDATTPGVFLKKNSETFKVPVTPACIKISPEETREARDREDSRPSSTLLTSR